MRSSTAALLAMLFVAGLVPLTAQTPSDHCEANPALEDSASAPAWNGWGADISNSRFQTASAAQLTALQVPRLTLKWSFGLPGAKQVFGEPVVVAGRVFLSADTGVVYSLDAGTGCVYWTFQAEAGVRTALSIRTAKPSSIAYFGQIYT